VPATTANGNGTAAAGNGNGAAGSGGGNSNRGGAGVRSSIYCEFVDSENVVTRLTSRTFGPQTPDGLGQATYEVSVPVPLQIADGPATYRATEVPKCNWMQRLFPVAIEYPPVEFIVSR